MSWKTWFLFIFLNVYLKIKVLSFFLLGSGSEVTKIFDPEPNVLNLKF